MTVACMAWVFKQTLPPVPKMVLLTLADQADDETGSVCYGRTDLAHIAEKTSMGKRALFRHLGALVLNGYLIKESGATKGTPNLYWICLDRPPTPAEKFKWSDVPTAEEMDDDDDDDGGSEDSAHPPGCAPVCTGGVHLRADAESSDNQSTKESPPQKIPADVGGNGFSKKNQDADRSSVVQEREAAKPAQYFVIEGSDPWKYWLAEMRRRKGNNWNLTCDRVMDGRVRRGWYFPSLYPPPKPKAPPGEANLSAEDIQALSG